MVDPTNHRPHASRDEVDRLLKSTVQGDRKAVEAFLARGFDANSSSEHCETPLMVACAFGHAEIVDLLISRGADVNISDDEEFAPLHISATNGEAGICQKLIDAGAHVDVQDNFGRSPLHYAADGSRREDVARVLIANGADEKLKDLEGITPLMQASGRVVEDVIRTEVEARELRASLAIASSSWSPSQADVVALSPAADASRQEAPMQQRSRRL